MKRNRQWAIANERLRLDLLRNSRHTLEGLIWLLRQKDNHYRKSNHQHLLNLDAYLNRSHRHRHERRLSL